MLYFQGVPGLNERLASPETAHRARIGEIEWGWSPHWMNKKKLFLHWMNKFFRATNFLLLKPQCNFSSTVCSNRWRVPIRNTHPHNSTYWLLETVARKVA